MTDKQYWVEKSSSKERRLHFLLTGHLSDCEILVVENDPNDTEKKYEKTFKCHKMILACASEVFERIFFSDWPECDRIEIVDVSAVAFEVLLIYIYTNEFSVNCPSLQRLNELLYLGNKYMMQDFIDCIYRMLEEKTCWQLHEILPIYELSLLYEELRLMMLSYKHIQANASILLKHQTFLDLNVKNLKRLMVLLASNEKLTHYQVFHAFCRYGVENGYESPAAADDEAADEESLRIYREVKEYVRFNGQKTDYSNLS